MPNNKSQIVQNLGEEVINSGVVTETPVTNEQPTTEKVLHGGRKNQGGGGDETKLSESNKWYGIENVLDKTPEYQPSQDKSAGSSAATGTQYSWDKQGADKAQNQYAQEVLNAKQNALANRQTIEQNALQYQQQSDMMKYANNQNAEKVGWTGGYVLDQNRQMEYLKASIQAQMYGAMELQKYGYDSALAAARLSYDLNQQQFAHQYYQDAVNVAITEAQITGTYFSAETRDMMAQYNVANEELKDLKDLSLEELEEKANNGELSPEQMQAYEIKNNITKWYKSNGLGMTPTGIQTLAAWESEQNMVQNWANQQWTMYQAALESAEVKEQENADVFIKLDENGNPIYNGSIVETVNFRTMSAEDIINYIKETNADGKEQVFGYIDNSFEKNVMDYISTAKKIKDANGNETIKIDKDALEDVLKNNTKAQELGELLGGYQYTTQAGDSSVEIKIDEKGNITATVTESKSTSNLQTDYKGEAPSLLDENGNLVTKWDGILEDVNKIYSGDGDDLRITYNSVEYDLTVRWNGQTDKKENELDKYYMDTYGEKPKAGTIMYYEGAYWVYTTKHTHEWGKLITGKSQDSNHADGEKFIAAINGR